MRGAVRVTVLRKPEMNITGIQVKAARTQLRISVRRLSAMADVSQTTILQLEIGRTRGSRLTFLKLQRALELSGAEFVTGMPGVRPKAAVPAISDEAALPDIPDDAEPYDGAPV